MPSRSALIFPLTLLAIMALLTFWIDRTVKAPEKKIDGGDRHDPDYILHNFVTTRTDHLGNLHYILKAAEMKHYPDDDSTSLVDPNFGQYTIDRAVTKVESESGTVSSSGNIVEFKDNVKVVREAYKDSAEMNVYTQYLKVLPNEERSMTDRPVTITQGEKTKIYAMGMIYDKKLQTLELLGKVKVRYENPNARTQPLINKQTISPTKKTSAR